MPIRFAILRGTGLLTFLAAALGLAGCNLPGDELCSAADLVPAENLSPSNRVVDSLTPALRWTYPTSAGCSPDHWNLWISHQAEVIYQTDVLSTTFVVPASVSLEPGHTYDWGVDPETEEHLQGSSHAFTYFNTGPLCPAGSRLMPASLIKPADGGSIYPLVNPHVFGWENPNSCWPGGENNLQISARADFDPMIVSISTASAQELTYLPFIREPFIDCGRFYWRVAFTSEAGGEWVYSETRSFILRLTDAVCPLTLITPVPPERHIPLARVKDSANCRSGPTTEYPILDVLNPGSELPIQARNRAGDSWLVEDAQIGRSCWVHAKLVEVIGSVEDVQLGDPDPPPTEVPADTPVPPVDCAGYNANTCFSNPACEWDQQSLTCKNK